MQQRGINRCQRVGSRNPGDISGFTEPAQHSFGNFLVIGLGPASPGDNAVGAHEHRVWARRAGLSERTLARLIARETGMNFGRWRQQFAVMFAVKWLAGGASIQEVANDLGYESIPSFATMFRKTTGVSPGRYMTERHARR